MITRNAAASVGQVVVGAAVMFLLYRTIVQMLGPDMLGIWSVVGASVSATRIGELGIGASVTRFVAKRQALGSQAGVVDVVQTASVSVGVLLGLVFIPSYFLLTVVFRHIFALDVLDEALGLLPYSMISMFLASMAAVLQSGLDGCQRYDRRAAVVITGQVAFLVGGVLMSSRLGLIGLAWAQIGQGAIVLVFSWFMLSRSVEGLPLFPYRWNKVSFKEMLGYGLQLQLSNIAMMLFEPLTKVLLGKFGGLAIAGYFEMASQFVSKARSLIVSANQVIVPLATGLNENDPVKLREMYHFNLRLLIYLIVPLYAVVIAWAPLLSSVWIGYYESQFVVFVIILVIAWALNTLNVPAYFINLGTGRVFWNTTSHVVTGVSNVVLGLLLGWGYGAWGVVVGAALSLVLGSVLVLYGFHREQDIPWSALLPKESVLLIYSGLLASSSGYICYYALSGHGEWVCLAICLLIPLIVLLPILWYHPLRLIILLQVLQK
jgi:O-antigen/teichoic acid export membrane protein